MSNAIEWYYKNVIDDCIDYMDYLLEDGAAGDNVPFDEVYEDLIMYCTGNDCGYRSGYNHDIACLVAFEPEFINYVLDIGYDLGKFILERGAVGVDVLAACMTIDNNYRLLEEEWNERVTQYNLYDQN